MKSSFEEFILELSAASEFVSKTESPVTRASGVMNESSFEREFIWADWQKKTETRNETGQKSSSEEFI